ncbi:hypothetical protein [Luteolibacter sp. Populi]|uniref:hypothetical protein n=1 Tax=Luteolibacter sp. Populi TaxID=3230487 RepID=UPI003465A991
MKASRQPRRYVAFLLAVMLATALIAAALNTWVDPLRVTGAPWASREIDPYRDISANTRSGKAGLVLARKDWQAAIFGSSRVISSLDPQAAGWGDKRVVNLGMPGALLYENVAMAEYFLSRQPAELLVFGIDPGDLTNTLDTRPFMDFLTSPLSPEGKADRQLRFIFGISTMETSIETLSNRGKRPGEYNDHGFRNRPAHGGGGGAAAPGKKQIEFIKNRFIDEATLPPKPDAGTVINRDKAAKLEALIRHCRSKGVRLVMFMHPNHVLLQAKAADIGKATVPFETERRALVAMVERLNGEGPGPAAELWDFYSYHPYNRERVRPVEGEPPTLVHWRDLEHFTQDVGEGMLSLMMGWPVKNPDLTAYGEKISSGNVEGRVNKLQADYQRYLMVDGADDVRWKEGLGKGK